MSLTTWAKKNKMLVVLVCFILVMAFGPRLGLFSTYEQNQCDEYNVYVSGKRAIACDFGIDWINLIPWLPHPDIDCSEAFNDCQNYCAIEHHIVVDDISYPSCEAFYNIGNGDYTANSAACPEAYKSADNDILFDFGQPVYQCIASGSPGDLGFLCKLGQMLPNSMGTCDTRGTYVLVGGMIMASILVIAII